MLLLLLLLARVGFKGVLFVVVVLVEVGFCCCCSPLVLRELRVLAVLPLRWREGMLWVRKARLLLVTSFDSIEESLPGRGSYEGAGLRKAIL